MTTTENPAGTAIAAPPRNTPLGQAMLVVKSPEFRQNIAEALPPGVDPDRFVRTAITALNMKPELAAGDRASLYNSIVQAAQMKLLPDNREGALVAYNAKDASGNWTQKIQFQPMVQGIVKRFGEVGILAYAASVYANESFRAWNNDTGQHVEHEPIAFGDRGEYLGAYAVAHTPDGRTFVEILGEAEIAKVRNASRSKDKQGNPVGPWKDWPDRMAQKSALHRLGRRVPVSDESLAKVLNADADFAATPGDETETAQTAPQAPRTRPRALDAVAAAAASQTAQDQSGDHIDAVFEDVTGDPAPDTSTQQNNPNPPAGAVPHDF